MVSTNAYTWVDFVTGTDTAYLYGTQLNYNFDYVSAMINKGITGANIATSGIDAESLFAGSVITEGSIDYGTGDGMGVVQIGKDRTTTGGQMLVKGTALLTAANTTNTDVEINFANGDVCTGGDPGFTAVPHVRATCYTADTAVAYTIKAVATDTMLVNVDPGSTATFTENWTIYWQAIGDL